MVNITDPTLLPPLACPLFTSVPHDSRGPLTFIPWQDSYLQHIPADFRDFFVSVQHLLSVRTTDVHTAICLGFLDDFIQQIESSGVSVNRNVVGYALILHDCGWSQLSDEEIASSLGVTGLKLTDTARGPKEKHAVLGAKLAEDLLRQKQTELNLSNDEINLICRAVLYHDRPEEVAELGQSVPIEVQLLVDLDHIWSFTQPNFWLDIFRKNVPPDQYAQNLEQDLDTYFITDLGRSTARRLLAERKKEIPE